MIGDGIVALLGCEIMLDIYGFYQNTCDIVSMLKKSYKKSKLYKFLIFGGISSSLNYLLKCIVMTWLLIDWNVESCFYFALGFSFTAGLELHDQQYIFRLRIRFLIRFFLDKLNLFS